MEKGVNIIITNEKNEVLILKRALTSKLSPSLWNLPGGRVEKKESLNQAVVREAREETSLRVKPLGKPFYVYHYPQAIVYAVKTQLIKGSITLNKEHSKFKWVSKDAWEKLRYTPSGLATLKNFFE